MDLMARRAIQKLEGEGVEPDLQAYTDPNSDKYEAMVGEICKEMKFSSLRYHRLDHMLESIGVDPCKLCTYCWNGKE
jgi:amidophosphoribosyltransferase